MRYASIDLLRTIAIFLMVIVHFLENLSGATWGPAGLGAPMFGFLVGVSYRIWLNVQIAKGRTDREITRSTFRRGAFIFVVGFIFNIAVWLPADTFNWDVLTFIGSAFIVLMAVRDLPPSVPSIICVVAFVLAPILRVYTGYQEYWQEGFFDPEWNFSEVSLGYLVTGYFPIFPWIVFPLMGYVVGIRVIEGRQPTDPTNEPTWLSVRPVAFFGLTFILIALILRFTRTSQTGPVTSQYLRGWTMFPPSLEYTTGMIGIVLSSFALAFWWIDGKRGLEGCPRLRAFCRTMSQYSLSIYILHHIVHIWPLWLYGVFTGYNATHFWQKALPWYVALPLVLPCIVLSYLLFRWVERGHRTSLESLLRRYCDVHQSEVQHPR